MSDPKYEGTEIMLGGEKYIVPALSFRQLKKLYPTIEALSAVKTPIKMFDGAAQIIHAAISRNYPDLTQKQVEDWLDLNNIGLLVRAVLGSSGFVQGGVTAGSVPNGTQSMPT